MHDLVTSLQPAWDMGHLWYRVPTYCVVINAMKIHFSANIFCAPFLIVDIEAVQVLEAMYLVKKVVRCWS